MSENKNEILKYVRNRGMLSETTLADAVMSVATKYAADASVTIQDVWRMYLCCVITKCIECTGARNQYCLGEMADCPDDTCTWNTHGRAVFQAIRERLE